MDSVIRIVIQQLQKEDINLNFLSALEGSKRIHYNEQLETDKKPGENFGRGYGENMGWSGILPHDGRE